MPGERRRRPLSSPSEPRSGRRLRTNVLGVGVSAVDLPAAVEEIGRWIETGQRRYVCVTGVHGIMESRRDPALRAIHNRAGLVVPDGVPLVWLSRWWGHHPGVGRVYGPDLMLAVCAASESRGWRHFLYGGDLGVAPRLAEELRHRFPALEITGTFTPPFRPLTADEEAALAALLKDRSADILWVGLSTPKQERWMAAHVGKLPVAVLIGVGAAFDFHTGRKPQAPRWMQKSGLEWLFRLASEPRRLAGRYLRNNPTFVTLALLQWLGWRSFPLDEGIRLPASEGSGHDQLGDAEGPQ